MWNIYSVCNSATPRQKDGSMISIALLGAGRIGQIHGRNIAASPRAKLAAIADPFPDGRQGPVGRDRRSDPVGRRDPGRQEHRCRADRHADRHPCRLHRRGRQGRQGGVLRKAGRHELGAHQADAGASGKGRHRPDDRLQPALRSRTSRRCRSGSPTARQAMSNWSPSCRATRRRRRSPTSSIPAGCSAT